MIEVKRMTKEEAEECAAQIVNEAIVFNKVGIQVKNIWIGKILDHLILIKRMSLKKPEKEENKIDFAGLWNRSSDEEKLTFFKRYDESQCPASTMYVARYYFQKLGLDHTKLMKW